jgi:hypothetical protein
MIYRIAWVNFVLCIDFNLDTFRNLLQTSSRISLSFFHEGEVSLMSMLKKSLLGFLPCSYQQDFFSRG